ncbi:MAG: TetR/AcrR family transcriptional regulator [Cellulosilyticum sp.]|nr:TetR/AcrR family transcriptional regulator [Cellulosilyticum sp.]
MADSKKEALSLFHRQNILKASESLFLEKGFVKTTMDDIAKAAHYSKATLYVYFKSKEEILNHLTLESMKMLYSHLHEALIKETDFFARYRAICCELVDYSQTAPLYFEIVTSDINVDIHNPETPAIFKEIYEVGEQIDLELANFLTEAIKAGYVKEDLPILPTIFWFWGSLVGIIRIACQKQMYITKAMDLTQKAFLDYSFKTLLQSILKEDIANAY